MSTSDGGRGAGGVALRQDDGQSLSNAPMFEVRSEGSDPEQRINKRGLSERMLCVKHFHSRALLGQIIQLAPGHYR